METKKEHSRQLEIRAKQIHLCMCLNIICICTNIYYLVQLNRSLKNSTCPYFFVSETGIANALNQVNFDNVETIWLLGKIVAQKIRETQ